MKPHYCLMLYCITARRRGVKSTGTVKVEIIKIILTQQDLRDLDTTDFICKIRAINHLDVSATV